MSQLRDPFELSNMLDSLSQQLCCYIHTVDICYNQSFKCHHISLISSWLLNKFNQLLKFAFFSLMSFDKGISCLFFDCFFNVFSPLDLVQH